MSRRIKRAAPRRGTFRTRQQPRPRRLHLESLESRTVLSGTVNIEIFPNTAAGFLNILGDGSNNQVEIRQTANPHQFFISSPDDTLFQINGAGATVNDATINGITDLIYVALDDGNDDFSFLGISPGVPSNIPTDLMIENADGSNNNLIDEVLVNGDLFVQKNGGSSGYSELAITNSTVIGDTVVDNFGVGAGDTRTRVDNSALQGGGPSQYGLYLNNPEGNNITDVMGNSQIGNGSFIVFTHPIVQIYNAGGGSRTTFTGASQTAGPGTTTVYGQVGIYNGDNLPGTLDIVTFNSVNVLGYVEVENANGDTESVVASSTLGSQLIPNPPGSGDYVRFRNEQGFDSFTMTGSTVPWGLLIDNDYLSGSSTWGSTTDIADSSIGEHPFGPTLPTPGDALQILGDDAADAITVSQSILGGTLNLSALNDGNNTVTLDNNSSMAALYLQTGVGNDTVSIDNARIIVRIMMDLGDGADTLNVHNINVATQWPSALLGWIQIDAGFGVDTLNSDVALPGDIIGFN